MTYYFLGGAWTDLDGTQREARIMPVTGMALTTFVQMAVWDLLSPFDSPRAPRGLLTFGGGL